ncbi:MULTISPECIES: hypothetical protein [Luteimonas]|uniref:hypothetical protein n=1 Tax=Luteimonas TaxID=83614 RepID=UPI000C799F7D|nr:MULTISPECIES: hypothetical protein [Luteimonas]
MTTVSTRRHWPRLLAAFVAALVVAAVWGSLVQTQFNLGALTALGVDLPWRLRLLTSVQDLVGFGPAYLGIVLAGWLPAFLVAALLVRRLPRMRTALYALAAGVGVVVAIRAVDAVAPMPVLIDATRGTAGLVAMALGSVAGGALFALWTRRARTPDR